MIHKYIPFVKKYVHVMENEVSHIYCMQKEIFILRLLFVCVQNQVYHKCLIIKIIKQCMV